MCAVGAILFLVREVKNRLLYLYNVSQTSTGENSQTASCYICPILQVERSDHTVFSRGFGENEVETEGSLKWCQQLRDIFLPFFFFF